MIFTDFEGANFTFTRPKELRDDQCGDLKVRRGIADVNGDKFPVSTSAWKPSAEDLERLNAGGLIYLNIFSTGHPMVSVGTELIDVEHYEET
jgi:hypothetical protein